MPLMPHNGIIGRSILITLIAFLVAGIGALTHTWYSTATRAAQTVETRLEQLLDTVQSTVKIACFLNDPDLAKEVSIGLLSNSEVLRVTIEAEAITLADERRKDLRESPAKLANPPAALSRKVYSPFTAGKHIGTVTLVPNPAVIATQRDESILLAVKQLAWQLLLVSGAIVTALIVFVVRPISRMSQALHKMDTTIGARLFIPPGHQNTEIGHLVTDINQLADNLVAALNEAREARQAAEAAAVAKGHFLANMSHEIRTPLTAVQGFARIGARDTGDPASKETFQRILAAGTHLLGVINDILEFSKIEAGKLVIEEQPMRLADVTGETFALMRDRAIEKGLELNYRPSENLPEWVMGDAMRIRQILVNLLSNAIKFSRHGQIGLTVLRSEDEVWFAVRDEGIGMTQEELSRLFRPFEQADSQTARKYGGTGLGLSISMNLASLMGGTIQVVSTPWHGSTFTLQLPLREIQTPKEDAAPPPTPFSLAGRLAGYRILAAEDNETNRLILADMLDEARATCVFAENGRVALKQVSTDPHAFDVVLMDVQMPEMDGNEATRRIHEIFPALPIIGLTAHGLPQDRATSLAAGMQDHVTKPIDPRALVTAVLVHAIPGRGAPAQLDHRSHVIPPSPIPALPSTASDEVDWALLGQRFGSKPNLISMIIQSVLDSHTDAPVRLREYVAARNFSALAFLAHSLKGALGNLAATGCANLAAAAEQAARQQDEACLALAEDLATRIDRLLAELEHHLAAR